MVFPLNLNTSFRNRLQVSHPQICSSHDMIVFWSSELSKLDKTSFLFVPFIKKDYKCIIICFWECVWDLSQLQMEEKAFFDKKMIFYCWILLILRMFCLFCCLGQFQCLCWGIWSYKSIDNKSLQVLRSVMLKCFDEGCVGFCCCLLHLGISSAFRVKERSCCWKKKVWPPAKPWNKCASLPCCLAYS